MKMFGKLIVAAVVVFAVLQVIRPAIPTRPATAEIQAPVEVKQILQKDCYSCHSDQRRLAWFDQIVPAYWLVRHDILTAREHLNFETIGSKPAAAQKSTLFEAVNMIQLGAMPLPQFVRLHPEARVTAEELSTLKAYLAPWSTAPAPASSEPATAAPAPIALASVPPEFNGVPFDPTFESWKPISTTDRGDNNTFRFILGNDIAIKAAQSGNITPWPDGSRFAKVAWQQETSPDGLIRPGKFIQVELMIKDANLYKSTEGWGWGRWRGFDLKPYGTDAKFVTECTTCHLPVKGDDYVYTLPMTQAKVAREEAVNNHAAALPASLPFQPLAWNAITMFVDPKTHTTATLYGNEAAIAAVQPRGGAPTPTTYPEGSVLALVTWVQREDPHWFGGRIPDSVQSVEFVQPNSQIPYRRFTGSALAEDIADPTIATHRAIFVTSLAPARLP
ncbi:cytochrome P460 family protein [Granulicella sibirica]|uniref:Putative cytochrome p460 n=1 Tax=Granulicella sibirica TaxID=2479048 RepID=A0A4Q0T1B2_9BACT|nr:cytochrome P460 family protein [Granulicella sibirica]RXH56947.1 putative cytochrome p460 [Granulicella sibirica]